MELHAVQEAIDVRGKTITTFIIHEAVLRMNAITTGDVLEIIASPFAPIENDVKAWCRMTGHRLIAVDKKPDHHRFYVEKGIPKTTHRKLALVLSNPGLAELLSPLGFALGAALEGIEVHLFFQGPAVRVLKQGYKARLHGFGRPFSRFARKGMAAQGHLPPQEKLRQLKDLGARFYVCGGSLLHFKVEIDDLLFSDIQAVEYLSFMEVMHEADIHLFLQ